MRTVKLLGATVLHTRYGDRIHPRVGRRFVCPVRDDFRNFPGLVEKVAGAYQRALKDQHTIHDQQLFQWMAQAEFGFMDIYGNNVSIMSASREEIIEDAEEYLGKQDDSLLYALFASVVPVGD
jgi:hypothetical protein